MAPLIAIVLVAFSLLSIPQQRSPAFEACIANAKAQSEIHVCASEELARVERELDRLYGRLLTTAAGSAAATEKIEAQRVAWLKYRDAYLDAAYPEADKQAEYGSKYPADSALIQARLTETQVKAVRALLDEYERPEQVSSDPVSSDVAPVVVESFETLRLPFGFETETFPGHH